MRTSRLVTIGAALATLAAAGAAPAPSAADAAPFIVRPPEVSLDRPYLSVFFPERTVPARARAWLAKSGDVAARRVALRRYVTDDQTIDARAAARLVPDVAYDDVVDSAEGRMVAPAAVTARAPAFAPLASTTTAAGETFDVGVRFLSHRARFAFGGVPARVVGRDGDGGFSFVVPPQRAGTTAAAVTAVADGRFRIAAPEQVTILAARRSVTATVDGFPFTSRDQGYEATGNHVRIVGNVGVTTRARSAGESLVIDLPVGLEGLAFPVAYTEGAGAAVSWTNIAPRGAWFPGPRGEWVTRTCSVTLDAFDGTTLSGRFTAGLRDAEPGGGTRPANDTDFDVSGAFRVAAFPARATFAK